jgi:hypothetical protein
MPFQEHIHHANRHMFEQANRGFSSFCLRKGIPPHRFPILSKANVAEDFSNLTELRHEGSFQFRQTQRFLPLGLTFS